MNLKTFVSRRPMPQTRRRVLVALFVVCAAATLWFAFVVDMNLPRHSFLSVRPDHLRHVVAFCVLSLVGFTLWGPYTTMMALLVAAGVLLELVQWPFGRQMALADLGASVAGVALGFVASLVLAAVHVKIRNSRG